MLKLPIIILVSILSKSDLTNNITEMDSKLNIDIANKIIILNTLLDNKLSEMSTILTTDMYSKLSKSKEIKFIYYQ